MLDDATVHIEDAASCGYRYTTATRLDVYSTTHRCVEWPCFTEAAEKGAEKGRSDASADRPAASARTSRAARATAHEAVKTASSWAPIALTVLGGQAVVMLQERYFSFEMASQI